MSHFLRCSRTCAVAAITLLAWVLPGGARALEPESVPRSVSSLDALDLATRARSVTMGGELRLELVRLPELPAPVALELERFEVVKPDARVLVQGHAGEYELPLPRNVYFKGGIDGDPSSLAVLVVHETGGVHGFLAYADGIFTLGQVWAPRHDSVKARVEAVDSAGDAPWQCGSEALATPRGLLDQLRGRGESIEPLQATTTKYEVEIAIDTDYEFWALFGDDTTAMNYITTLVAGASAIYDRDINAQWKVSDMYIYNAGAASDPWGITGGTFCSLLEVGNYWKANRSGVSRDLVHFLSGKDLGGGVAWLGVLCDGDFACSSTEENCGPFPACSPALPNPSYGGGYAFSAGILGNYTGSLVWDIVVTTHEGGHNFGSPHSHCYKNYPNAADPVIDECYAGEGGAGGDPDCWADAEAVPSGGGSIMSYCHLQTPGLSNINLYLGRAGFYGTNSERVQARTRAEVEDNIACLTEVGGGCPGALVLENQTLSGAQTLEATTSATLGPSLIVDGTNIVVNAPIVTILDDTELGGTFSAGNVPSCI